MAQNDFEPRVLCFLCNWCCYTAADSAGVARYQYPPNARVIRVMCTGRIDPLFLIEALFYGADGVFVGGCHPGECHYLSGNYEAQFVVAFVHKIIEEIGLDPKRLLLDWASAAEAPRFVSLITEFIAKIKALGQLGKKEGLDKESLSLKLEAAKIALEKSKLRMAFSKQAVDIKKNREKGQKVELTLKDGPKKMIKDELNLYQIILSLKRKPYSLEGLANKLNISKEETQKHISLLTKKGLVTLKQTIPTTIYAIVAHEKNP